MTYLKKIKKQIKRMDSAEMAGYIYKLLDNTAFMNCQACPAWGYCHRETKRDNSPHLNCRLSCDIEIAGWLETEVDKNENN